MQLGQLLAWLLVAAGLLVAYAASADSAASAYSFDTRYIIQQTDHFSLANKDTFAQKYLVNDEFWCRRGCPILFYCGHDGRDGNVENFAADNTGWMWEYGRQLGAMLVFAEHRFYGSSAPYQVDTRRPSANVSHQLGYLTSSQAMADFAHLILHLKGADEEARHSPVIALSGGYGGMLAAWMRMSYPHLVQGAYASSAPIQLYSTQADCNRMSQVITRQFEHYSPNCRKSVAQSWRALFETAGGSPGGLQQISASLNLCDSLQPEHLPALVETLSIIYYFLAMTDYANEAHYYVRLPARPLQEACRLLEADPSELSHLELLKRVNKLVELFYSREPNHRCLDTYAHIYPRYLWDFQVCTDLILPHCGDGINDMFYPYPYVEHKFLEDCEARWNVAPRLRNMPAARDNQDLSHYSNLIFVANTRDPYIAGIPSDGIPRNSIHVLRNEGAAFMEDLRASGANDSATMRTVRQETADLIKGWVEDYRSARGLDELRVAQHQHQEL